MNDQPLSDAALAAFEAHLASLAPQPAEAERAQLLYECGLAAGRRSTSKRLRCWQFTTAAAGILALCLGSLALMQQSELGLRPQPASLPQMPVAKVDLPPIGHMSTAGTVRDAWQVSTNSADLLDDELARFRESGQHLRSLAVGRMYDNAGLMP
jgi:hypothetical protein